MMNTDASTSAAEPFSLMWSTSKAKTKPIVRRGKEKFIQIVTPVASESLLTKDCKRKKKVVLENGKTLIITNEIPNSDLLHGTIEYDCVKDEYENGNGDSVLPAVKIEDDLSPYGGDTEPSKLSQEVLDATDKTLCALVANNSTTEWHLSAEVGQSTSGLHMTSGSLSDCEISSRGNDGDGMSECHDTVGDNLSDNALCASADINSTCDNKIGELLPVSEPKSINEALENCDFLSPPTFENSFKLTEIKGADDVNETSCLLVEGISNYSAETDSKSKKELFKCEDCGKNYRSRSSYKRHMRYHSGNKPHVCSTCGRSFARSDNLMSHMYSHSVEKLEQCDICGKYFTNVSNLNKHRPIHSAERPHKCPICGKGFKLIYGRNEHIKIHSGLKPYQCDICEKKFTSSGAVTRHKRMHTNERPYICEQCGKAFRDLSTLRQHVLLHSGSKPYPCSHCDKAFWRANYLARHMRKHTREKPYLCNICGKAYFSEVILKKHLQKHTKENSCIDSMV